MDFRKTDAGFSSLIGGSVKHRITVREKFPAIVVKVFCFGNNEKE
ncbi:MAG: hypothetical protein FD164_1368 [Nitrospirae bacterium]|nr:MAG: hypothetical protein FD164_1368 [Nitrospirota bacterium]